jgi:hypothetical protein
MAWRSTAIGAIVVAVLAGCGSARHSTSASKPPLSAGPPPPFGSGSDHERAEQLASAILRQRLEERSETCLGCLYTPRPANECERQRLSCFEIHTEAVSWTPTHLLVQFVGRLLRPDRALIKNVEVRVLIALMAHNTLKLAQLREHTLARLHNHETPTRVHGKSEHP